MPFLTHLALLRLMFPSNRNHSISILSKSIVWFLCSRNIGLKWVKIQNDWIDFPDITKKNHSITQN